ncbi:hypothetical protein BHM03_00052300 [Ensete ventricosum]|nr:hypothetical protein BHM03_00052300 [Ensete ventricosum]
MVTHRGKSSKMQQVEPLPQVATGGLQMQTRSQAVEAAQEERDSEQGKREVGYSPQAEEAQSRVSIGKRSHRAVETRLDILEVSLEELYQG